VIPWVIAEEDGVTEVLRLNNFYYPVEISFENTPPLSSFPWIEPSKFLQSMGKMNDLTHLLGGKSLVEARTLLVNFWKHYREIFPMHQLFRDFDAHKKRPWECLPIFLHGDEGVHYKKNGILVLSLQGAFGFGSSKRAAELGENLRAFGEGIPLNFLRTGFQTRILIAVCPKECLGRKIVLLM